MVDPHRPRAAGDLITVDEGPSGAPEWSQLGNRFAVARHDERLTGRDGFDDLRVVIAQVALRNCPSHTASVAVSATGGYKARIVILGLKDPR